MKTEAELRDLRNQLRKRLNDLHMVESKERCRRDIELLTMVLQDD